MARKNSTVVFKIDANLLEYPLVAKQELERQLFRKVGNTQLSRKIGQRINFFTYLYGKKR